MMKELINKSFGDEAAEVINLYEKYELAKNKDIVMFGNNFYTPNVWKWFLKHCNDSNDIVQCSGVFKEAERCMISFNNKYYAPFPFLCIKITNKSKFNELNHKDYLGAVLSLGIQRNKIGDLIVEDNCCYLAAQEEIADYIIYNLEKIGRTTCKVEVINEEQDFPRVHFKEEIILIPSLRLDALVGKLCNITRAKAVAMIEQGMVLADYNTIREKSYEVKSDERITIRRKGKYIIGNIVGKSKSDKIKLCVKKYT